MGAPYIYDISRLRVKLQLFCAYNSCCSPAILRISLRANDWHLSDMHCLLFR